MMKMLHNGYYNKLFKYNTLLEMQQWSPTFWVSDVLQRAVWGYISYVYELLTAPPQSKSFHFNKCSNDLAKRLEKKSSKTEDRFVDQNIVFFSSFLSQLSSHDPSDFSAVPVYKTVYKVVQTNSNTLHTL